MKRSNKFGLRRCWRRILATSARPRREAGAALLEVAMVTPLLSIMLVGILYGGMTFYNYVVLADAVASGARVLVTNRSAGSSNPNACQMAVTAVQTAAHYLNQSNLTITTNFAGSSTCDSLVQYDKGTVSATYPCSLTIPFTNLNLCPLTGQTACGSSSASCIGAQTQVSIE